MTQPTGNPRGRPPGARNKRTAALEAASQAAAAAISQTIPDAFQGDAHAFLVAIYKDPSHPVELRIDAAKAALRFEKPALAAVDMDTSTDHVHYVVSDRPMLTDDEWLKACGGEELH